MSEEINFRYCRGVVTYPEYRRGMGEGAWIGKRVANMRDVKGMTQQEFADALGVTQSYLSKIEAGKKAVTQFAMLTDMADLLRVNVIELIGLPLPVRAPADLINRVTVEGIRSALFYSDTPVTPRPERALIAATEQVTLARMNCDYAMLSVGLPPVLAETRALYHRTGLPQHGRLWIKAAVVASLTLKPLGWSDLAKSLADQAATVARMTADAVGLAAAEFAASQCARAAGARQHSLAMAQTAANVLRPVDNESRAWRGLLHLHAAFTAAGLGDEDLASTHFGEAEGLAGTVRGDPWYMEFGLPNVATWRLGAELEKPGSPERVPELARLVPLPLLVRPQRLARAHMDIGRGLYQLGEPKRAIRHFLLAHEAADSELRSRPSVLEIVGQMQRNAKGGGSPELRKLVTAAGLDLAA